jgi:hypothetical protein
MRQTFAILQREIEVERPFLNSVPTIQPDWHRVIKLVFTRLKRKGKRNSNLLYYEELYCMYCLQDELGCVNLDPAEH